MGSSAGGNSLPFVGGVVVELLERICFQYVLLPRSALRSEWSGSFASTMNESSFIGDRQNENMIAGMILTGDENFGLL